MVTVDLTLFLQIGNMVLLMYLLNIFLYKPVRKILSERQEKLQGMRDDVQGYEQRAASRQKDVDAKMAEASGKAKAALDKARDEAQRAGDSRIAAIKEETEAMKEKQLAELKSEIGTARNGLEAKLDEFATEMAGKILGRSV